MYCFSSPKTLKFFIEESERVGFRIKNQIIWKKNNWTAGDLKGQFGCQYEVILLLNKGRKEFTGKKLSDIWEFDRVSGKYQLHQNQKPLYLITRCIEYHSKKDDIILDPFMGSGTTIVSCINTERHYIGFEIDPRYYQITSDRIAAAKKIVNVVRSKNND